MLVVKRFFEDRVQADHARFLEFFDGDAEVDFSQLDGPYRRVFRGREEMTLLFREMNGPWRAAAFAVGKPVADADWVVIDAEQTAHHALGFSVSCSFTAGFRLAGGKITYFKVFRDRAEALAAAGLAP